MLIEAYVSQSAEKLEQAGLYFGHGTETAWDEASWLILHVLGIAPTELVAADLQLSDAQIQQADALLANRISSRKPLAYLVNSARFCGQEYYVDERVIVPRSPIAELITQQFTPWLSQSPDNILDLCTGSACIAIACAHEFEQAQVDAVDIDDDALAVAAINVERHKVAGRVNLIQSDVFSGVANKRYDLIVTNPPYVDAEDMAALPTEYQREPGLALAAGEDGLDIVRKILLQAAEFLTPDGILVCEVGNSEQALNTVFPGVPFMWLEFEYGGQGVFLLTAAELNKYQHHFYQD